MNSNTAFPLDATSATPTIGVACANGRFLKMGETAFQIWSGMQAGLSPATLASSINTQLGYARFTETEIVQAHAHVKSQIAHIEGQRPAQHGQWLRLPLIPARVVSTLSKHATCLFTSPALALAALAINVIILLQPGFRTVDTTNLAGSWLVPAGWVLLATLFHELGHAAALRLAHQQPGAIGVAMYLIFPVFYSDVTQAWRLPREQRMLVDVGGPYFSLLASAFFAIMYWIGGDPHLQRAAWLVLASVVTSLNPLLRYDGYWFLIDALGITDLRKFNLAALVTVLRGSAPQDSASRWARRGLLMYLVLLLAFIFCTVRNLSQLFASLG